MDINIKNESYLKFVKSKKSKIKINEGDIK